MTNTKEQMDLYNKNLKHLSEQVFEAARLDIEYQKMMKRPCTQNIEDLIHNYVTAGSPDPYTQGEMKDQLMQDLVTNKDAPYRKIKSVLKDASKESTNNMASLFNVVGVVSSSVIAKIGFEALEGMTKYPRQITPVQALLPMGAAIIGGSLASSGLGNLFRDADSKNNVYSKKLSIKEQVKEAMGSDFDGNPSNHQRNSTMSGYNKLLSRKDYTKDKEVTPKGRKPKSEYPAR